MTEFMGGYILASELAKQLSLKRKFFNTLSSSEHFDIRKVWGHFYVKPSEQIIGLLTQGYIAVPKDMGDDDNEFDVIITLKRIKLGFWRIHNADTL
jgi:hypothetical protein